MVGRQVRIQIGCVGFLDSPASGGSGGQMRKGASAVRHRYDTTAQLIKECSCQPSAPQRRKSRIQAAPESPLERTSVIETRSLKNPDCQLDFCFMSGFLFVFRQLTG